MTRRLFVGGLPYAVSDQQLEELFTPYGSVESARVVTDRMTGRSRGFGFVELSSEAEAAEAKTKLNGTEYEGRTLTVNEARPRMGGSEAPQRETRERW
jgi:RNA recognition motif-containing protein